MKPVRWKKAVSDRLDRQVGFEQIIPFDYRNPKVTVIQVRSKPHRDMIAADIGVVECLRLPSEQSKS